MGIRHCRDLRKMGDAKDLPALSDQLQLLPDLSCRDPGNPGVDFIEDQCGRILLVGKYGLDGKHDTGQFSSGGHAAERL